ncbi:DoxX family protein [Allorhizobium undicola]|uniref:DoxX family protein n=1 Tax=Allorhizobium undicola TaxID=78527 RepID=UPI003D338081
MPSIPDYPASGRTTHIIAWILQVLLALAFFAAAAAKLAGAPMMVENFAQIGLGQFFRYITAGVEIIGAVALLLPRLTALGGLWLSATMLGATIAHLTRLHTSPAPALVLLFLCLVVVALRREQIQALIRSLRSRVR